MKKRDGSNNRASIIELLGCGRDEVDVRFTNHHLNYFKS